MTKKIISIFALAAVCATVFTGCKKEHNANGTVTLGVNLEQVGGPNSKIFLNSNDKPQFFTSGESVKVNDVEYPITVVNGKYLVTPTEDDNHQYYAIYPASMAGDITPSEDGNSFTCSLNFPATQNYVEQDGHQKLDLPVGAVINGQSQGNELHFFNLCSLVEVKYTNPSTNTDGNPNTDDIRISSIEVTAIGKGLYGTGTATVNGTNSRLDIAYNNVKSNSRVVLEMGDGGVTLAPGATGTYYVMVPPYDGTTTFSVKIRFGDDGHSSITKTTSNPVELDRNMIVSIVTNETPVEDNEISGYYSISSDCKVVFSKGNLQHWASDENNWHFAENQYDYYGRANVGSDGQSLGNVVDLFYWSIKDNYEYWYGGGSGSSYGVRVLWEGRDAGDEYYNRYLSQSAFNDWGNLVIDGDPANTWFTLTATEWDYLLNGRDTRDGITRRVNVNITGVPGHPTNPTGTSTIHGCMLFPDDWTTDRIPSGIELLTTGVNEITYTDFRRLEAVGCVLLPECGYRYWGGYHGNWDGATTSEYVGHYWTATYSGGDESYMMVYSYNANRYVASTVNRNANVINGCAVRLAKPAPGYTYGNAGRQGPSSKK